jgi:hypothetical protein
MECKICHQEKEFQKYKYYETSMCYKIIQKRYYKTHKDKIKSQSLDNQKVKF